MAKLKEVLGSEVHWQVADWHTKDQANIRIRQLLGDDARYFAPLYVTHGGYYWADADPAGWTLLTDAPAEIYQEALAMIEQMKARALARFPAQKQRIETVFARPNDDYVFVRRREDMSLDVRLTGWGFQNYHRSYGGPINETLVNAGLREVAVAFTVDGIRQPQRRFSFFRGTAWADADTGADGLYDFGQLAPGTRLQLRDTATGIERIVEITDDTSIIDIDVTEYLTLRVTGREDGVPIEGEEARVEYGHRTAVMTLTCGVAECRLPYLHGVECTVALRGQTQRRQLDKDILNVFDFDFVTPPPPPVPEEPAPEPEEPVYADRAGDCTLRVIEKDGRPSAGTTCVLEQGTVEQLGYLDAAGEMHFESSDFVVGGDIKVRLTSSRRDFPPLQFTLDADEKEYELREIERSTPWWKIALEILLLLVACMAIFCLMAFLYGFFNELPLFFY